MQNNQPSYSLEDQIGYNNPPFIRPLEDSTDDTVLSNTSLTKDLSSRLYYTQPAASYSSSSKDSAFYTHNNNRDSMSDVPSTSTPRLSDVSSLDSPRNSLEHTPTVSMNGNSQATAGSQPAFNPLGGKTSPLALDETRIRRSSPDSDALASSDEEAEQKKMSFFPPNNKHSAVSTLSSRRPSYAAEFQNRQRTYSMAGGGPLSPTTSHPSTPSGDTAAWAAEISTSGIGQSMAPIWSSIWNDSSRKSPPKALNVSSSVSGPSTQSPLFAGSEALPSPTSMPVGDFPIPIPLQPQPRNYRSMSFSVLDDHTRPRLSPPALHSGSRPPPAGLQHRPSRPSLLSEEQYAGQCSPLRSVFETEDDEETGGPRDGMSQQISGGYLQQASGPISSQQPNYMRRYESMKFRNRSASAASIPTMSLSGIGLGGIGSSVLGGGRDGEKIFPGEEYESALADDDDMDFHQIQNEQRRYSEVPRSMSLLYPPSENQRLENLRNKHWATVGAPFGSLESGSQSRRHSFAGGLPINDYPDKEMGFGGKRTISPPRYGENGVPSLAGRDPFYIDEMRLRSSQGFSAASKTAAIGPTEAPSQHHLQPLQTYSSPSRLATQPSPPPTGPHRGLMSMTPHHAQQSRSQQVLYFVSFKSCRGDVFYVQEGTGLRVRNGDLVIVEADRGTDLGTVIADNITWQQAKEMKERSAKQQYNLLMMLASRKTTGATTGTTASAPGFADGTSGVMPGSHQGQDGGTGELKPKMIKRLAQTHEIQTLRDKEANEAKAKRVCQQKVAEHRLPMEILDAEFQMDWKKLTFYYFADSYINFNSLVTDLFKVYKTRIWMSAMNPASFAHPTGLHPPGSGLTPANGLASIGETPNEAPPIFHTPQYGTVSQSYAPGYNPTAGGTGGMMSTGHRGHTQQPGAMSTFPGRQHGGSILPHQDFNHLSQQQLNGYNSTYLNGATSGHIQGEGPTTNGGADAWMTLPGLSLHSH